MSARAVVALLFSLAVFCPPLTLAGPLVGLGALREMRTRSWLRGRGYAIAAIVIGSVVTAVWAGGMGWWHIRARRPMLQGPQAALRAGLAGDVASFRDAFTSGAAEPEAAAFLEELRRRYGTLRRCELNRDGQTGGSAWTAEGLVLPYLLVFERTAVEAQARFVVMPGGRPPVVLKWGSLEIRDPEEGDLAYPTGTEFVTLDRSPNEQSSANGG